MNEETKRKNILDLQFQKYLVVASTSVVISFTYLIGVGIAILTKQINLGDYIDMFKVFIFSSAVLGTCAIFLFNAMYHLRNIPEVLKNI